MFYFMFTMFSDGVLAAIPDESLQPTSICGHLQLLFALLQFSKRRYAHESLIDNNDIVVLSTQGSLPYQ